jgi:hypothetical protein
MTVLDGISPIVLGPEEFATALEAQSAQPCRVDWHPPHAAEALAQLYQDERVYDAMRAANRRAMRCITEARCNLVDIRPAREIMPGPVERGMLLHAGPPLTWSSAAGPMRGAMVGAVFYEGWAPDHVSAERLLSDGAIRLEPCHDHDAVGPMAGIISPSMPVFVVENTVHGNRAYSTLNEGYGKVLRYGANDEAVLTHLRWLSDQAAPLLAAAIREAKGIDLTAIIAQALHMGDELHNRNTAATALFTRVMAGALYRAASRSSLPVDDVARVFEYLRATDVFFINLSMAACKAALDPAGGIHGSTLVTAMARNGTDFGIRVSGAGGRWFTAPAPAVDGLYFPGYGPEDANPDIGDSAITETGGLGGFALAAAPAIVQFVGGTPEWGRRVTEEMYQITLAEHPLYQIPSLDFRGTPVGIDAVSVCRTGITPVLDTGIAHREAGIGQIGAGIVRVPIEPFAAAVNYLRGRIDGAWPAG